MNRLGTNDMNHGLPATKEAKRMTISRVAIAAAVTSMLLLGSMVSLVMPAGAAPAKGQKLICFSGGGGVCTIDGSNNTATLDNPAAGAFSGVYVNGKSYSSKLLSAVDF